MSGESAYGWLKVILALVFIAVLGWLIYWLKTKTVDVYNATHGIISDTVESLNPTSANNVIYQGYSNLASYAAGREETLGGWFYDITHRAPVVDQQELREEQTLETNPWGYGIP